MAVCCCCSPLGSGEQPTVMQWLWLGQRSWCGASSSWGCESKARRGMLGMHPCVQKHTGWQAFCAATAAGASLSAWLHGPALLFRRLCHAAVRRRRSNPQRAASLTCLGAASWQKASGVPSSTCRRQSGKELSAWGCFAGGQADLSPAPWRSCKHRCHTSHIA